MLRLPRYGLTSPEELEQYRRQGRAVVLNPKAAARDRLAALALLRGIVDEQGNQARDGEVVDAMIDLFEESQDPEVRADVFRQLHGTKAPALLTPLLNALVNDPSKHVREEAAETLSDYLPDPAVVNALEYAAQNDPDEAVREQARESLDGKG